MAKKFNDIKNQNVVANIKKDLPKVFNGYYNPLDILEKQTSYKMVISKRSDGKSFAFRLVLYYAFQKFNYTSVIIRRLDSMIKPSLIKNDFTKIFEMFPNINFKKYDGISYYSGTFRGYWINEKNKKEYDKPFVEYLSVNTMETTKSSKDYTDLYMILFDEFLSRDKYLTNEYILWNNLLATIIRNTENCIICMLANPVSFESPYFNEYGINARQLPNNTITVYKSGKSQTSIAIEKLDLNKGNKKTDVINDKYFGFDKNHKVKSITTGIWESPMYPRLKKQNNEVIITDKLFVKMDNLKLRLTICKTDTIGLFVRVSQFYNDDFYDDDIIFDVSENRLLLNNVYSKFAIESNVYKIEKTLLYLYQQNKYFYSDNMVGESLRLFWLDFLDKKPKQLN